MDEIVESVIKDLSKVLNITIKKKDLRFFSEGTTESIVFRIEKKYLVKIVDENTLKTQIEFLKYYENVPEFQKIICYDEELRYLCFEYIDGKKLSKDKTLNPEIVVDKLCHIVSEYKEYDYQRYGYLWDDHRTWWKFLFEEVQYASQRVMRDFRIPLDKVNQALEDIDHVEIKKYLIDGDFGAHNFIVSDGEIRVIDPMPVVGDYLYDFYFAMLSNVKLLNKKHMDYILSFFDRDMKYKKALFVIVLYIRMSRCYIYNKKDFAKYVKFYNKV